MASRSQHGKSGLTTTPTSPETRREATQLKRPGKFRCESDVVKKLRPDNKDLDKLLKEHSDGQGPDGDQEKVDLEDSQFELEDSQWQ